MGARKLGDGRKPQKVKAACRADTRGGSWAGIPKCLIDSPAHRDLSLHARAILVELIARMNGYNNGAIAVSQRELKEALGCSPNRVVAAIVELVDHYLIEVTVEGEWASRQARQYRLTFVSTKDGLATNDYLRWTPSKKDFRPTGAIAKGVQFATGAIAGERNAVTAPIARLIDHKRKTAVSENAAATGVIPLIREPYPQAQSAQRKGDDGDNLAPLNIADVRSVSEADVRKRNCENCGSPFTLVRADRASPRRYCSEPCRKSAEAARRYDRRRSGETVAIGAVISERLSAREINRTAS